MKLVLVISDLGGGGAQRVLLNLAAAWSEQGHDVQLVTLNSTAKDRLPVPAGVGRASLDLEGDSRGIWDAFTGNLVRVGALRSYLKKQAPHIVVSFILQVNVLTVLASIACPWRLVISERNDPAHQDAGGFWDRLRRLSYRFADVVTGNSPAAVQTMARYVAPNKLVYVPNTLHLDTGPEPERRERFFLAVGRLHSQKGYDILLDAYARVSKSLHGWRLVILGAGAEEKKLKKLARELGIGEQVEWAGFQDDTGKWYRRAGVFVMASRFEGMPNALLEALAHRLPCVISDACLGPLDFLRPGESALVAPVEDAEALASQMLAVANDRLLADSIASAGRGAVERAFDPRKVMEAWNQVILPAA